MRRSAKINYLDLAANYARTGIQKGWGGPFGAIIVHKNKIIAKACNTVLKTGNPTKHAEVNAIHMATRRLRNTFLRGAIIYSTTEPCPMCFSALHWAQIKRIIYSTTISDVKKLGFNELSIPNQKLKKWGKSPIQIKREQNSQCHHLLQMWKNLPANKKKTY